MGDDVGPAISSDRARKSVTGLLHTSIDAEPEIGNLRYQLLTATAGALAAARRDRHARAIPLVQ